MEYHYTVIYDDMAKTWRVEPDPTMFYHDGNVYDQDVFPGWFYPEEGSDVEALDNECFNTLLYIAPTFPTPEVKK